MGFRIMQLQYETMKENAVIEEGILLKRPRQEIDLGFAILISYYTPQDADLRVTTIHEFIVEERGDGFKGLKLNVPYDDFKVENEEGILLVIQYASRIQFDSKVKRVAGRYSDEGIYLLKPNDKISITRGELTEQFVALQFEKKMYLVKVHED